MPRHHETDRRAVVARLRRGSKKKLIQYRRRRHRFPVKLPRYGPRSESETLFEELAKTVEKPTQRERPSNEWIRPSTWSLIDHKATLAREGKLNQRDIWRLVRKIKAHLQDCRRHRTGAVGASIVGHLEGGELAEAWKCLKGWYAAAGTGRPSPDTRLWTSRPPRERICTNEYPR